LARTSLEQLQHLEALGGRIGVEVERLAQFVKQYGLQRLRIGWQLVDATVQHARVDPLVELGEAPGTKGGIAGRAIVALQDDAALRPRPSS
jgi:hypothetical protein